MQSFSFSRLDHLQKGAAPLRASHPERRAYLEARIRAARLERFSPELERMQALVQNLQEALKNCNSSTSNI